MRRASAHLPQAQHHSYSFQQTKGNCREKLWHFKTESSHFFLSELFIHTDGSYKLSVSIHDLQTPWTCATNSKDITPYPQITGRNSVTWFFFSVFLHHVSLSNWIPLWHAFNFVKIILHPNTIPWYAWNPHYLGTVFKFNKHFITLSHQLSNYLSLWTKLKAVPIPRTCFQFDLN